MGPFSISRSLPIYAAVFDAKRACFVLRAIFVLCRRKGGGVVVKDRRMDGRAFLFLSLGFLYNAKGNPDDFFSNLIILSGTFLSSVSCSILRGKIEFSDT